MQKNRLWMWIPLTHIRTHENAERRLKRVARPRAAGGGGRRAAGAGGPGAAVSGQLSLPSQYTTEYRQSILMDTV